MRSQWEPAIKNSLLLSTAKTCNFRIPLELWTTTKGWTGMAETQRQSQWYGYDITCLKCANLQDVSKLAQLKARQRHSYFVVESQQKVVLYDSRENDKIWCQLQLDCHSLCYRWTIMDPMEETTGARVANSGKTTHTAIPVLTVLTKKRLLSVCHLSSFSLSVYLFVFIS